MSDTINVFRDQDVQSALQRLLGQRPFMMLVKSLAPDMTKETLSDLFSKIHSIADFQKIFVLPVVDMILAKSTKGLTYSGVENLEKDKSYLFISNHRDIILDSTFINYILIKNGIPSTQLAIGDNLLVKPWITDFLRLNKSFLIRRNIAPREIYQYSVKLSQYIKNTIGSENTSIWIAQREGRAKDGNDTTQTGVLKMLTLGSKDVIAHFKSLQIVPVSISYELDPNAEIKVTELYAKKTTGSYTKSHKDDLKSMITGIVGPKGRVHVNYGKPIDQDLDDIPADVPVNGQIKLVADLMDKLIQTNYKLWPENYIAADLMNGSQQYAGQYSDEDKKKFLGLMELQTSDIKGNKEIIREIFLAMYANPLINKNSQETE